MNDHIFGDRAQAGHLLAAALAQRRLPDPVVLALPRGGVPVAVEVALALHAPLDLLIVRKIGAPGNPELAVGAIAEGAEAAVADRETMAATGTSQPYVDRHAKVELREIERRRALYLRGRPPLAVEGRTAIVVDDGLATGSTALAAVRSLRLRKPARIVLAVPVAPPEAVAALRPEVDALVCLSTPEFFGAVGVHYADFRQVADEEVIAALARVDRATPAPQGDAGASRTA
jgi:putative phosphoribosyl transferase